LEDRSQPTRHRHMQQDLDGTVPLEHLQMCKVCFERRHIPTGERMVHGNSSAQFPPVQSFKQCGAARMAARMSYHKNESTKVWRQTRYQRLQVRSFQLGPDAGPSSTATTATLAIHLIATKTIAGPPENNNTATSMASHRPSS
jgi:hypothetical protein